MRQHLAAVGRGWRAAGVLCAAALAGCASAPKVDEGWIRGRLSVRVEATADREATALSAEFELRGNDDEGELRLTGAIGSRLAEARWGGGEAQLDTGRGAVRYADLESLSREAFGEALPLRALPDWLAGRPWRPAGSEAVEGGFAQLGWTVRRSGPAGARIEAVRAAPPRVVVRVQLEPAGT